jgi:tRNA dimethylallyltransferase
VSCQEKIKIEHTYRGVLAEAAQQLTQSIQRQRKKVIVIAGPTAIGKSAFAMALAKSIGGEIVSADSMQVYRHMDIGTAKPPVSDRQLVPHHLVDIRDITESFNVVDFYYEARHSFLEIHGRDSVPIVVGGSGFYLHSLIYGPPSGPPSVPELRQELEVEIDRIGPEALYKRLLQLDPRYAGTITPADKQKIVRALEIITLTGKPVSELSWRERDKVQNYDFRCWFLCRPRESVYQRIESRCDVMLQEGLLDEVQALLGEGLLQNSSAAQAIGYRQTIEFFNGSRSAEEYRLYVENFKRASRHYAKRQFTWFKREPLFRWLDLDLHDPEIAADMVMQNWLCEDTQ